MKRFKNILALYDRKVGDEAALDRAVTLARSNDARLTVAEAIEKMPKDSWALLGSLTGTDAEAQHRFCAERRAHLERLTASINHDGIEVRCSVLLGRPFLEVIRAVLEEDYDLVIMTADIWRGLRQATFGSTSMHLMRKCPCPVWVMQPQAGRRFQRILAAIDPDLVEEVPSGLDVKIMQMASSLARIEGCRLDILHAWDFVGRDLDTSRSEISEDIMAQMVERNRTVHHAAVERLLGAVDLAGVDYQVHLPKGDPASAIPELVSAHEVDLIVMGTVAKTGIAGFFIGDTAEEVLRQVSCSVLTVKPDGFVTPVVPVDRELGDTVRGIIPSQ